jgi:hypothetical protein
MDEFVWIGLIVFLIVSLITDAIGEGRGAPKENP